ncbi:hypothetical protein B0H14DRAFT_2620320 [Mycena olivaceomarginata]|nr:hypothetical protein B0H14DRAFT_2620320 [Mycena olivaceomarginata]
MSEQRQEKKGQHGEGNAEAKSACTEERGCRGKIGMHGGWDAEAKSTCREGMQRPNRRAWKMGCRGQIGMHGGEGQRLAWRMECRGQIGVHRGEGLQKPNRRARRRGDAEAKSACMEEGMQRPNRHAWRRGDAEAKSACTEEKGLQRPNRRARRRGDAEAKSACMEEGIQRPNRHAWRSPPNRLAWRMECRGQIGVHRGEGLQRPNRRARRRGDAEAKSLLYKPRATQTSLTILLPSFFSTIQISSAEHQALGIPADRVIVWPPVAPPSSPPRVHGHKRAASSLQSSPSRRSTKENQGVGASSSDMRASKTMRLV